MQSPYTEYDRTAGVEKASVELAGFAKTKELSAGESETVKITVEKEQLKTYDSSANGGEGTYILESGTYLNFAGWYAPAMNIHRTAFSGRNFEYYSEDEYLSGVMGLATTTGARSKGVITFVKHYALNDQETGRIGLSTFASEQAIREIYLAAFEPSMSSNTTLGAMLAMNRIGFTWSENDTGLSTNVTRNEWGYDGILITDQASYPDASRCLAIRGGLEGGTDLYLNTGSDNWQIEGYASNPTVMNQLRKASKHILYAVSRSFAMNGISSSATVKAIVPLWQKCLYVLDVLLAALLIFWGLSTYKRAKKQQSADTDR